MELLGDVRDARGFPRERHRGVVEVDLLRGMVVEGVVGAP